MREFGYRVNVVPGTQTPKSTVFVPLFGGTVNEGAGHAPNVIGRTPSARDGDSWQTLANSMSVALENAVFSTRPSAVPQNWPRSTRSDNAWLVSSTWRSLIDLVGEQILTTFSADIAYVALLNEETDPSFFLHMVRN